MPLNKQNVNINFAQGIDTKTDPYQVTLGKFLSLQNTVFTKGGLLQKRNGYQMLTSLPDETSTSLNTFNSDLTAIGSKLEAFSSISETWWDRGNIQPIQLSIMPLIRNNTNQSSVDTAFSSTGFTCTVYTDQTATSLTTPIYKYTISDSETGQTIIAPQVITNANSTYGTPKVFVLGRNFIIVYTSEVVSSFHLQYIAINASDPSQVGSPIDITNSYTPSTTVNFDAAILNNSLFFVWNGAAASGIKTASLTSNLSLSATHTIDSTHEATLMSVTIDVINQTIWASYYNSATSTGYVFAMSDQFAVTLTPTQIISSGSVGNITSIANENVLTVIYEVNNNYGYDAAIPTHYLNTLNVTILGVVGAPSVVVRSVGLASKAFLLNNNIYFLSAYQSPYQSTYFLLQLNGNVLAKLAYQNGGGYLTLGLPSVSVNGNQFSVGYLFKDLIQSVNKNTNVPTGSQVNGIYSQTGVNLATFTLGGGVLTAEIGTNLNITGGFLWGYDGYIPVENNFYVYPDSVEAIAVASGGAMLAQEYFYQFTYEWTDNQGNAFRSAPSIPVSITVVAGTPITFHSVFSAGVSSITVSSAVGLQIGQIITDTTTPGNLTGNTYITSIVGLLIGLSQPTAGASTTTPGDVLSTSQVGSATIDVPTLRLTYKKANPVKIVGYRWSAAQEQYYQFTSIFLPILNDTTIDYVTITDTLSDFQILGNNLIYTSGGVVENVGPPSFISVFLFDDRLWGITSEDRNLLWYSKQIIESTPVEMSDLFTLYVAPSIGAQGSTGPLQCGASMDDKLILFKSTAINYVNGTGPDNTGANSQYSQPIFITATVGCSNQNSIVFQPQGLMFEFSSEAGNQIWLLGRDLSTQYIGAEVESLTKNALVQSAVNIPGTNQVRFTLDSGVTIKYDYYYRQWDTDNNIPAISSTLYQGLHTYINSLGEAFQETPGLYLDGSNPVLMSFTTSWIQLAGLQGYQRAYFFYILATYITPHKLNVQIAYNYNSAIVQQDIISPVNYSPVYGLDSPYGHETPYGGAQARENWRVFFRIQRCESFQLVVSEIYDPSYGVMAGAGLTLSGLNVVVGIKKGYRPIRADLSVG